MTVLNNHIVVDEGIDAQGGPMSNQYEEASAAFNDLDRRGRPGLNPRAEIGRLSEAHPRSTNPLEALGTV